MRIPTLRAFESFPVDIMHILFINIPKYMWMLWSGSLEEKYASDDFVLREASLVGRDLEDSGSKIPT